MINCKKCDKELKDNEGYSSILWYAVSDTLCDDCSSLEEVEVDLIDEVESFSFALEEYKDLVKEAEDNLKTAQEGLDKFRADNKNKENLTNKNKENLTFDLI